MPVDEDDDWDERITNRSEGRGEVRRKSWSAGRKEEGDEDV